MTASAESTLTILLVADCSDREALVRGQLEMLLPSLTVAVTSPSIIGDGAIPSADAAVVDGGTVARETAHTIRVLRARGFSGPMIVITAVPDDADLLTAMRALGVSHIDRTTSDSSPSELARALTAGVAEDSGVATELRQARRTFAAGQVARTIQHGINNPLAALLAEAQLLQMEELGPEQRDSVDRMVELCRRIVALVRRLDALADEST